MKTILLPCLSAALLLTACDRPQQSGTTTSETEIRLRADIATLDARVKTLETRVEELASPTAVDSEAVVDDDLDLSNVDVTRLSFDELRDPEDLQNDFELLFQRSTGLRESIRMQMASMGSQTPTLGESTVREVEEVFAGEAKATALFKTMATRVHFTHDSLKGIVRAREQLLASNEKLRAAFTAAKK